MDSNFVPAEFTVRHFVNHKFTLELGPSIISLGKGVRNTVITLVLIKFSFDLAQAVLNRLNPKDSNLVFPDFSTHLRSKDLLGGNRLMQLDPGKLL